MYNRTKKDLEISEPEIVCIYLVDLLDLPIEYHSQLTELASQI